MELSVSKISTPRKIVILWDLGIENIFLFKNFGVENFRHRENMYFMEFRY